jgi:hypothetical protein
MAAFVGLAAVFVGGAVGVARAVSIVREEGVARAVSIARESKLPTAAGVDGRMPAPGRARAALTLTAGSARSTLDCRRNRRTYASTCPAGT